MSSAIGAFVYAAEQSSSPEVMALFDSCLADDICSKSYRSANRLKGEKDYSQAITEFLVAYGRVPCPLFLFNAARLHDLSGNYAQAVAFYKRYIDSKPRDAGEKINKAQNYLTEAQGRALSATVNPQPPAKESSAASSGAKATPAEAVPAYRKKWFWPVMASIAVVGVAVAVAVPLSLREITPSESEAERIMPVPLAAP